MRPSIPSEPLKIGMNAAAGMFDPGAGQRALQEACQRVMEPFEAWVEQFRLYILDEEAGLFCEEAVAGWGAGEGSDQVSRQQLPPEVLEGESFVFQHGRRWDVIIPLEGTSGVVGLLAATLLRQPKPALQEALRQVAQPIALGVEFIRERRRSKRTVAFLQAASQMSRALSDPSAHDESLARNFVGWVVSLLGFDRATLALMDPKEGRLERALCAYGNHEPVEIDPQRLDIQILNAAKGELLKDLPIIGFPLRVRSESIGMLVADNLYSLAPIMDHTVEALENLTGQIALALDHARLLGRLQKMALRDDLTGLFRPGYLRERVQEHLANIRREARSISLIIVDLDGFKEVNDTHGHLAGDAVLRQVAQVIESCIRAGDIPSRIGGDEFAVLLPGIERQQAQQVADRLNDRLAETPCVLPDGAVVTISASVGVATLPEDGSSWDELFDSADEAMYGVKRRRKVRLHHSGDGARMA